MRDQERRALGAGAGRWLATGLLLAALLPAAGARAAELAAGTAGPAARERILLDDGWRFRHGDPAGAELRYDLLKSWILPAANRYLAPSKRRHERPPGNPGGELPWVREDFDDGDWNEVALPHDWAIAGPFIETGDHGGMGRLPSWGTGWYRRDLEIPESDRGRSIFLEVEGAMAYAAVWLNGRLVGGWPYGYNSWQLDLTPYLRPGAANQLAIRLENSPESSRWYPGGGLYRDLWLVKTGPVHVGYSGSFATTPEVSRDVATVELAVTIDNDGEEDSHIDVESLVFALDHNGERADSAAARSRARRAQIPAGGSAVLRDTLAIQAPRLWGPPPAQSPELYVAVTTLARGGETLDVYETVFGIRKVDFDPDRGVLVNGTRVPLQGVNLHHDLGALGAAFNRRAAERQLELLQDMGVNAIRTAHNPPAPAFLELTDRMGFLVVDEIFDVWQRQKTPSDFHLIFDDWHEADLRNFTRRDRNHPSVILWSVGNEVGEQRTGEEGAAVGRELVRIARDEDPTRLVTTSLNSAEADMPLPATMDVINLNYQGVGVRTLPSDFPAFRRQFPDKVIFSSESAAAVSSRGEYLFPVSGSVSGPVRPGIGGNAATGQVSAYELHAADFGSSADLSFSLHDQHPFVAGEFVWAGIDYLGEPTPYYSSRSSYFGIVDLAGFPKDRFYLYQSRWRPELPMAHILPHWTWPERVGKVTPVHVFTSGDEAELFLNGESLGRLAKAPYQYRLRWDYVEYEPGELAVVAYKDGREWARASVQTAGPPAGIELVVDRDRIAADGKDLAFVTARVVDAEGRLAPRASNLLSFDIDGPGEIVATDNGDPTSFVPFPSPDRSAFNGLALAIVRATPDSSGTIRLRVSAEGLDAVTIAIASDR